MKLESHYTNERNAQIVVALLKARGIRKVIASPGTTNISFVGSIQNDPFFEVYSWVDERSAAYAACGMAAESGEPIVLSCTGATASRNYLPGLTEAFYRKLPIIAITSGHEQSTIGNLVGQVIDRSVTPNDICVKSVLIRTIKDSKDEWDCQIKVNRALNALTSNGGGPVHINLETSNIRQSFSVNEINGVKNIVRHTVYDELPKLPNGRIGIWVGAHKKWSTELVKAVDDFCSNNNAAVFCDHTSNYNGKFKILASLLGCQDKYVAKVSKMDLLIHIGEVTGSYESLFFVGHTSNVWRVSEDGEIKDVTQKLNRVFDMPEIEFFKHYCSKTNIENNDFFNSCKEEYDSIYSKIPELPLSNLWVAKNTAPKLPENSQIHFAILNSLRSWNFFELPSSVRAFSNVGGFGIDGGISSLVGASLCNKEKIYFGVFGDLSFFYDLNVIGNRHVGNNIRIILINNGKGVEFRNYYHQAALWEDRADIFIAAGGHNGQQSPTLVKHFVEDLGFEYISVRTKEEYFHNIDHFTSPDHYDYPLLMEVFTQTEDEVKALYELRNIMTSNKEIIKQTVSKAIKSVVGNEGLDTIKKIIKY